MEKRNDGTSFAPVVSLLALGCLTLGKSMLFGMLLLDVYLEHAGGTSLSFAKFFRLVLGSPHFTLATVANALLTFALLSLFRERRRFQALLLINLILTVVGLTDLLHARFFSDVVSVSRLELTTSVRSLVSNVIKKISLTDALFFADVFAAALFLPFYKRLSPSAGRPFVARLKLSAAVLITGLALILPTFVMIWRNSQQYYSFSGYKIETAATIGILPYHLIDLSVSLAGIKPNVGPAEQRLAIDFLAREKEKQKTHSPLKGAAQGRNVIVISAESLQAFAVGLKIDGQPVTPRLDQFAAESLRFVNFYDQTHLGTTSDAEFMAMQSLYPLSAGVLSTQFHKNSFRGLPKVLTERGYTTVSMCGAKGYFWHMDKMHPALGFQKSFFIDDYIAGETIMNWLSDESFFKQSADRLAEQKEPFMAFLLSSSNHHPYPLPENHRRLKLGALENDIVGAYLQSVHYFDEQFGLFLDKLRESGLLENSVVLIYGDHHGFIDDSEGLSALLQFGQNAEFQRLLNKKRLPLLVRLPQKEGAGIKTAAGGQLDIAPTLLSLLGVEDEKSVMLGHDLTVERENAVIFRNGSFISGDGYLTRGMGSFRSNKCYQISTGREMDCTALNAKQAEVVERLKISDLIIYGNLIPLYVEKRPDEPAPTATKKE